MAATGFRDLSYVGIIMLGTERDKLREMNVDADHKLAFLTKPFNPDELLANVALLRLC